MEGRLGASLIKYQEWMDVPVRGVPNLKAQRKNERKGQGRRENRKTKRLQEEWK